MFKKLGDRGTRYQHIYFIKIINRESVLGDNLRDGFYFADETEDINGPYPSAFDALVNLKEYCDLYLNYEEQL